MISLERIEQVLDILAGSVLFVMTLLTVGDVAGRYLLNRPIPGAYQAIAAGMGILIFTGIPSVTARRAHLTVGLLDTLFVARLRDIQQPLVTALCCVVMAGLTWRLWAQARDLGQTGLLLDVLLVPVSPFVYYMAAMAAVSTGVLASLLLRWLRNEPTPP